MFMKKVLVLISISSLMIIASCGSSGSKDKKADLGDMKVKLEKLKKEKNDKETEIRQLEEEIAKADPIAAKQTSRLVSVDTLRTQDFSHYIELQGKIDANDIVYVTPRGMPSQVKQLYVKRGDVVRKGQ